MGFYDERGIAAVQVGAVDLITDDSGTIAAVNVAIDLTPAEGMTAGPGVGFSLGVPASPDASVGEIRERAIELAHDLIARLAREDLDELKRLSKQPPRFNMNPS